MASRVQTGLKACALAAALAGAATAAAASLPGCSDLDDAHLAEAVVKAQGLADQCLVKDGLSPDIGRRITGSNGPNGPTYHCAYHVDYAALSQLRDGHSHISVDLDKARPEEAASVPELRQIDLTVFHELIHFAAPDGRLVSQFSHDGFPGFPDGVYGCAFACSRTLDFHPFGDAFLIVFDKIVRPIPEDAKYVCPADRPDICSSLKKFASLCRSGAPSLSSDERWKQGMYEASLCLWKNFSKINPADMAPIAQKIRAAEADAHAKNLPANLTEVRVLGNYLGVVADTMKSDSLVGGVDRLWLTTFLATNSCPALPK